jgi:tetratricopeptide (TPR) repeat protein
MRDTAKTIECFDRAMALPAGTYPFMYWSMITFYRDAGQPQKVVLAFQQQITIMGSSWIAVMIENEHTARTRGATTVRLAAALCEAGYNYAWGINDNRREAFRAEAERLFKRAHDVLPESAIPFLGLGDLHFNLGERDEAYRCYRKSAALGSSDAREKIRIMDDGKR